ncbi:hypothetical protein CONPUDRAFT_159426 [Coniophora puteana RWD-64-598 SS2]|uniref:Oxidoreductase AflY n=1 Tax=Coniophora puteana (strain RWD-64-598) TaxID=741705 RepID=A0A5M3M9G4_CONPW|nr:uncharacterized protein CONPUDRAFT_159426 [Coniophora puteana RWD-64-598 SS2]EIW75301.1 hypothetical protein CONPUDRAFT_159426 [Coniophora puteana RWD-64-598 SS2]
MSSKLSNKITPGIVNVPGRTPDAQTLTEHLLAQDREKNHCFFNDRGFHNHLSHHILAAYDLGATGKLMQAIFDTEQETQRPRELPVSKGKEAKAPEKITPQNFSQFLGKEEYYTSYLDFFTEQIAEHGVSESLETFVFHATVNVDGIDMLSRFCSGAYHNLIQAGYGVEFGSNALVAQGLAQAAVHGASLVELFDFARPEASFAKLTASAQEQPHKESSSLLAILSEVYDSEVLHPIMPYDPDMLLSARRKAVMQGERPEAIRRISSKWWRTASPDKEALTLDTKLEELFWATTLLLIGSGKHGRAPRLDFFIMHMLNCTLFLPSLLRSIPSNESKVKLMQGFCRTMIMDLLTRGRPRIDTRLAMSYASDPRPPKVAREKENGKDANVKQHGVGDVSDQGMYNPWHNIVRSVVHAPDAHTIKAVRALYYAAQHYGHKEADDIPGAFKEGEDGQKVEVLQGLGQVDGTVFVRAAGVVMDTLGWVTHGQKPGEWDFSGLGWEDAWKTADKKKN